MTTFYQITKEAPSHGIYVKGSSDRRCYEFMVANVDLSIARMYRYGREWRGEFGNEAMTSRKNNVAEWLLEKTSKYLASQA